MIRTFALVLAFALLLGVPVADSAAQPVELADAGIVFGDCDTPDFQYSLTVPTVESGLPIGSDGAVPAGQSERSVRSERPRNSATTAPVSSVTVTS